MKKNLSIYISMGFSALAIFLILASQTTDDQENPNNKINISEALKTESRSHDFSDYKTPSRNIASKIQTTDRVPGTVDEWLKEWGASEKFKFQLASDGRSIMTVLGGNFRDVGHSEETAYDFLSRFAAQVGVSPNQLDRDSLFTAQTIRKKVYGYDQIFKGYPVFNSSIKVETKSDDQSAYMIHNSLKTIPESTPVPQVSVSLEQAKKNALDILNQGFTIATESEDAMVIWPTDDNSIDLAWSLILQGDHISEYVLVSATTGQILANYSAQSH